MTDIEIAKNTELKKILDEKEIFFSHTLIIKKESLHILRICI